MKRAEIYFNGSSVCLIEFEIINLDPDGSLTFFNKEMVIIANFPNGYAFVTLE